MFHSSIHSILFTLMDGPKNACQISRDTHIDNSLILRTLKSKKMKGLVERTGRFNQWILTEDGFKFARNLFQCESVLSLMKLEGRL